MELSFAVLTEFISPIILLACLAIGYILRNLIPTDAVNRYIPLIVGILGVLFAWWSLGVFDLSTFVVGAISGLASTGLYEVFHKLIQGIQESTGYNPYQESCTIQMQQDFSSNSTEINDLDNKDTTMDIRAEVQANKGAHARDEGNISLS